MQEEDEVVSKNGLQPISSTDHDGFLVPATESLQERQPRTLKHGDTFAVFDQHGDALSRSGNPEGLFHLDTRHLSRFLLSVGGLRPMLLSSTIGDDNARLTCDMTNPDFHDGDGRLVLAHDLIHIRRSRFLWMAACFERLTIRNFDDKAHEVSLKLHFAADFADLFEVRGAQRERRGTSHEPQLQRDQVTLSYTGLDAQRRETFIRFEPAPKKLTNSSAIFDLHLEAGQRVVIFVEIQCDKNNSLSSPSRAFFVGLRDARRALRRSSSRAAAIVTSNEILNEGVRRSVSDIYMLLTDTPAGPYPYAGIPWFSTVFGRDAIITALQTLWLDPAIARGVLLYLAEHQANQEDSAADAEPGKILHEVRHGEMANLGEVPFRCYYGSVDSTPLFIMLAGAYLERTGDIDTISKIWPNIEAALDWIDRYGDCDGDGFVEYGRRAREGLVNQGWKDSHDSIFHADGSLAKGPIALVEVQAYVYGAWRAAVSMARVLGHHVQVSRLAARADELRQAFDDAFWDGELDTYILALDGAKRPCRVRASNAGHALYTGIAFERRANRVVRSLMSSSSYSGWGVRTVACTEARYNPMSYHNGSVWPHDNAVIASGFMRYGFSREAARIFEGLFAASSYIDLRRLPELFCGFRRYRRQGPTFYPVACSPQSWAAASLFALIQSCIGLGFDPRECSVSFDRPSLPRFLDEIILRNLSLSGARVSVALRRAGDEVSVNVLSREGQVRVLMAT